MGQQVENSNFDRNALRESNSDRKIVNVKKVRPY